MHILLADFTIDFHDLFRRVLANDANAFIIGFELFLDNRDAAIFLHFLRLTKTTDDRFSYIFRPITDCDVERFPTLPTFSMMLLSFSYMNSLTTALSSSKVHLSTSESMFSLSLRKRMNYSGS